MVFHFILQALGPASGTLTRLGHSSSGTPADLGTPASLSSFALPLLASF